MVDQQTNIDKITFARYVSEKVNRAGYSVSQLHVRSVINVLFEEIVKDLEQGTILSITNFGELLLKQLPGQHHRHLKNDDYVFSPGHKSLRFYLVRKLRKFLLSNLDLDKSFPEHYDE